MKEKKARRRFVDVCTHDGLLLGFHVFVASSAFVGEVGEVLALGLLDEFDHVLVLLDAAHLHDRLGVYEADRAGVHRFALAQVFPLGPHHDHRIALRALDRVRLDLMIKFDLSLSASVFGESGETTRDRFAGRVASAQQSRTASACDRSGVPRGKNRGRTRR